MKRNFSYISVDISHITKESKRIGYGNVIRDSVKRMYEWRNDTNMLKAYQLEYLLATVLENSIPECRLEFWKTYVKIFRQFYGTM